jgi:hypothetical protein
MTETAAISAPTCGGDKKKLTHAERNEMKRLYMKARYQDPAFAAAKRADMLRRYHERVPAARWGQRGRLPKQTQEPAASAAAAILACAALAAVAAMLA